MAIDAYVCPLCAMTVPVTGEPIHQQAHDPVQYNNEQMAETLDQGRDRE